MSIKTIELSSRMLQNLPAAGGYPEDQVQTVSTRASAQEQSAAFGAKAADTENMLTQKAQQEKEQEQNPAYVDEDSLAQSAEKVNELIAELTAKDVGLSFSVEKDLDRTLISVTDRATDDLIRQIPSEEFVRMAKSMQKLRDGTLIGPEANAVLAQKPDLKGLLFDHEA